MRLCLIITLCVLYSSSGLLALLLTQAVNVLTKFIWCLFVGFILFILGFKFAYSYVRLCVYLCPAVGDLIGFCMHTLALCA